MLKLTPIAIILSSPSCGGKSTLAKKLVDASSDIRHSVSVTTRKPRQNEEEGVDYHFKSHDEFVSLENAKAFVETTNIYGNHYGTLKSSVNEIFEQGLNLIFDIDYHGMQKIKEHYPKNCVSIFVMPPSINTLRDRMYMRCAGDSDESLHKRLSEARLEIRNAKYYDYMVVNEDIGVALRQIQQIISANFYAVKRVQNIEDYLGNF